MTEPDWVVLGIAVYAGCVVVVVMGYVEWMERGQRMDGQQEKLGEVRGVPFDFNGNGVPDYQEGGFWLGLLRGATFLVLKFARPNSRARQVAEAADELDRRVLGGGQ